MRNPEPPVVVAWLRRILARTLADAVKHYDADCRAIDLERSLHDDLDRSASGSNPPGADSSRPVGTPARAALTACATAAGNLASPRAETLFVIFLTVLPRSGAAR